MTAVHHFVATYEPGAIGGHIVEMQRLCHSLGWASEVYTEHVRGLPGRDYREYPKHAQRDDLLVYHTAIGSPVADFVAAHLPRFGGPELYSKTCLYTVPPDQGFVLDTLPEHPQITVANGAGHAYKFAALIGRLLADLALGHETSHPIDAFSITRPALTDPDFPRSFHV